MSTEKMTGKERILAALRKQEVDRTPCVPLVVPYSVGGFPENAPHHIVDVMRAAGLDIWSQVMFDWLCLWFPLPDSGIIPVKKFIDGDVVTGYETPIGTITERLRSGIDSSLNPNVEFLLKTPEDLKIFLYVREHSFLYPVDMHLQNDFMLKKIGEDGVNINASIPLSPFQNFVEYLAGVENTYYLQADAPELFDETLDLMHRQNVEQIKKLAELSSADIFIQSENISWTTMSPAHYEKYVQKQLDDYADILHEHGKLHVVHMCGKLKLLGNMITKGKFDAIGDIAPSPTGDTELWEAAEMYPSMAVKGGVECNTFAAKDPKLCYKKSMEILERTKGRKGILLGSGDSVPYGTTMEHLRAMSAAVSDFHGNV